MAFDPVTAILNIGSALIDRLIPDKTKADEAKAQLVQMQVQGDLAQIAGQLEVDKTEAASNSVFVAGWRPYIGWICGTAVGFDMILRPLLTWTMAMAGHPVNLPQLDLTSLMSLLGGLLGFGVLRTVDKTQGTSNGH